MSIKIALWFWNSGQWCIHSTEGKRRENRSTAHSEIDVAKVLVKDDAEKERLLAGGTILLQMLKKS